MSARRLSSFAPLAPLLLLGGCIFLFGDSRFERGASLFAGEIKGTALFTGGNGDPEPAPYAHVKVRGTSQVRRADQNGDFVVWDLEAGAWVLQLTQDEDGDGLPDRRRIVSTILRESPHVTSAFGEQEERLTGVTVGEVVLEGTAEIGGQVLLTPPGGGAPRPPTELGRNVVVLAGRNFDLPKLTGDGFDPVSLGAQAKTHVDDTGTFQLRNLGSGALYLLVLVYEQVANTSDPASLKRVSPQVFVRAIPDGSTELAAPIVLPAADAPDQTTSMSLLLSPALPSSEQVYIGLRPPGSGERFSCSFPPQSPPGWTILPPVDGGAVVTFTGVPVGTWDIQVCTSLEDGGVPLEGFLEQETLHELEDGVVAPLAGPVLIANKVNACDQRRRCRVAEDCPGDLVCPLDDPAAERFCQGPDGDPFRDCDGDGRRGLPPREFPGAPLDPVWDECGACADSSGTSDIADATCEADGETFDCDDDGDGQADVTEPSCYGPELGGDSDSDGICDPFDAFPECRANTPQGCAADVNDEPQPPDGCEVRVGAIDAGDGGEGVTTYCVLDGDVESCPGYQMSCTTLEQRLVARSCEEDPGLCARFDPLGTEAPESYSLCDDEENGNGTFECHYFPATLPSDCRDVQCPHGFECDLTADETPVAFCRPSEAPVTVDLECLCGSPDAETQRVTVNGHPWTEPLTCAASSTDGAALWAACDHPPIVGVADTNGGGEGEGEGETDVDPCVEGQPVCDPNSLIPNLLTCPADTIESTTCSVECRAPDCVGGECTQGDACIATIGEPCNVGGLFLLDPTSAPIFCERDQACTMRLEALDGNPPQPFQECTTSPTTCSGELFSSTCGAQNTLEVCGYFNGEVALHPIEFNCQTVGSCGTDPNNPAVSLCIGVSGAPCDPDFDIQLGVGGLDVTGLPFVCNTDSGLSCQKDDPADRYGFCRTGAAPAPTDAGPDVDAGAG